MIEQKTISVLLNVNPKYLNKNSLQMHIEDLLNKNVLNNCFNEMGKILRINSIVSVGLGKIHIDTGFAKTPVTFIADVFMPKVDNIIKGTIEKYDSNGGIYVNYEDIVSIFCLNVNVNSLLKGRETKCKKEMNKNSENSNTQNNNIGDEVTVRITKVNINEQNMILIGKII
jgi:DNA-directed RNA polymerase subunit E'/Rpb7